MFLQDPTYVALWNIASLPSRVCVCGVAPYTFPHSSIVLGISTEVVIAYVSEPVFLRLLFRPLLTLLSGYCLCDASLIILPSFAVFVYIETSWWKNY